MTKLEIRISDESRMTKKSAGSFRSSDFRFRSGYSYWPAIAFLAGFTILIVIISRYYLLPALDAFYQAPPKDKKILSAHSALLLSILLLILASGLILTFRVGRFFFPRTSEKRTRTKYVDAWAEAGKRSPPT